MDNERFNKAAETWDENPHRRQMTAAVASALIDDGFFDPSDSLTMLEYGCGTAALSVMLYDRLERILAADSSAGMIQQVKKKIVESGLKKMDAVLYDAMTDPAIPGGFDRIVSVMALHHILDEKRVIGVLANLLNPGGKLIVADLLTEDGTFHSPDQPVPHNGFNPDALSEIFRNSGLVNTDYRTIHHIQKNEREYPIFRMAGIRH